MTEVTLKVEDRLHTVKEVAKIFSVEPATVRAWINSKRLHAIKPAKSWMISRTAMVEFANKENVK